MGKHVWAIVVNGRAGVLDNDRGKETKEINFSKEGLFFQSDLP
jgi:hypothetical protein